MSLLRIQRWSGILLLGALIGATHFLDGKSSHLRAELVFVLLLTAGVVHAVTSLYVVGTDYAAGKSARRTVAGGLIAIAAIGLGVGARAIALETRQADTPGHVARARCASCHITHPFRLDAHPSQTCADCHDVTKKRPHASSFDAPFAQVMTTNVACATCHREPPAPLPSPSASERTVAEPPERPALRPMHVSSVPADLSSAPWGEARVTKIDRAAGAPPVELRALSTEKALALRITFSSQDAHGEPWIAVLGASKASPSFDKMGCATSCHKDEKHRTAASTDAFVAIVAAKTGARVLDVDPRGMHASRSPARVDWRARGDGFEADFVFDLALIDVARGISIALDDGGPAHDLRARPLAIILE